MTLHSVPDQPSLHVEHTASPGDCKYMHSMLHTIKISLYWMFSKRDITQFWLQYEFGRSEMKIINLYPIPWFSKDANKIILWQFLDFSKAVSSNI